MSEETQVEEQTANEDQNPEATAQDEAKPKRRRSGNNKPRKPSLKDWIRVQKDSKGLPNQIVHVVINEATNLVELHTQAPVAEGSEELSPVKVQVFKITGHEVVNDADRDPLGVKDAEKAEGEQAEGEQAES